MNNDLTQRDYYKIFTGSNQAEGHDKIHLGYESSTAEIVFAKDKTTYFHIPFFSQPQLLVNSTLIANGAISGPIPAMADRILKKQAGYGKNTPWGETNDLKNGSWLCSWLYAQPNQQPQWLDRYYDPGRLSIQEALEFGANVYDYIKQDPIFYDVPSQMVLEPGVWYQYYHQGEKTNENLVNTFSGLSGDRIRLNINDWSINPLDKSIYKNSTDIDNFQTSWVLNTYNPGYLDRNVLNFDNNSYINCHVTYNESYNLLNEFTLQFWFYNKDWQNAPATHIVSNLSQGGYGVFYNNLKAYPYYALPETTYGHLFYLNQEFQVYTEKNIQRTSQDSIIPIFSGLNSNFETIVLDISSQKVYKYNHLGDVLAQSKLSNGDFYTLQGVPKTAIIDGSNNTHVLTTSGTYIFNQDLILTQYLSSQPYIENEVLGFNLSGNLVREQNSIDVKFDSFNNKWSIKTDNKLYFNNIAVSFPGTKATNIAIAPDGLVWVLGDINDVYVYAPQTQTILKSFKVGINSTTPDTKNITFVYFYDRENNTFNWYSIFLFSKEQTLYQTNLNGDILKTIFLPEYLNIVYPLTVGQDSRLLTFNSKGDYTGYEWKRIFNKALYNNKPQLQFKLAADQPTLNFNPTQFTLSTPIDFLVNETWYLVTCVFKNNEMKLYINENLRGSRKIPDEYDLVYNYKNNLYIGCPCGKIENLNAEINSKALIWNGYIDSIKVYNYTLDFKNIQTEIRSKILAQDIVWNLPTSPLEYIDTIERFFKHRLPGSKSPFYNIKLSGLKVTDPNIKIRIENEIRSVVFQIQPGYSRLLKIEWID
jgi:hypothetical protein